MLSKAFFNNNRIALAANVSSNSLIIISGNHEKQRNADQFYPFRQDSDFFYFTGIEQPGLVFCMLVKNNRPEQTMIIHPEQTEKEISYEGKKYDRSLMKSISGIENFFKTSEYAGFLPELLKDAGDAIYINKNQTCHVKSDLSDIILKKYPWFQLLEIRNIAQSLRMVKQEEEIYCLKQAAKITSIAFNEVKQKIAPGIFEYELAAEMLYVFKKQGGIGFSFAPIIAGGRNACTLHYTKNNQKLNTGDLLLMDFGVEYKNYASDITRTIPVNGTFSNRQKEVYKAVLEAYFEAEKLFVPGNTIKMINETTHQLLAEKCKTLGLYDKNNDQDDIAWARNYFIHGITHHIGLDVHDASNYDAPLAPGMVLSCEPGLYIKSENIGVRIENDLLITQGKPENLTVKIPIEIEELETS